MLQTAPNVLVMGGHQPLLVSLDLETRQEIQQVAYIIIEGILCLAMSRDVPDMDFHCPLDSENPYPVAKAGQCPALAG